MPLALILLARRDHLSELHLDARAATCTLYSLRRVEQPRLHDYVRRDDLFLSCYLCLSHPFCRNIESVFWMIPASRTAWSGAAFRQGT